MTIIRRHTRRLRTWEPEQGGIPKVLKRTDKTGRGGINFPPTIIPPSLGCPLTHMPAVHGKQVTFDSISEAVDVSLLQLSKPSKTVMNIN